MHGCQSRLNGRPRPPRPPRVVVACEVLQGELELLALQLRFPPELHFLPQSLHDTPQRLRESLQEAVDTHEARGCTRIVLGYGLCGQGLAGVKAHRATLVLPKVHDCIPLLLGDAAWQDSDPGGETGHTFWTSPGWLRCSQLPYVYGRAARLDTYRDRYGEESAQWLLEQESVQFANYSRACHIGWAEFGRDFLPQARLVADDAGLPLEVCAGSNAYLRELLHGGQDNALFLHLAPGETVTLDGNGKLVAV